MTVFARTDPPIGKRQTKLYLSEEAYERLRDVSKSTGKAMSVIVEVLIRDHCVTEGETTVCFGPDGVLEETAAEPERSLDWVSDQRKKRSFDLD